MSRTAEADGFSRTGALRLKEEIERYWRARGCDVVVYLREAPFSTVLRSTRYEVCSDMLDGMPRQRVPQKATSAAR